MKLTMIGIWGGTILTILFIIAVIAYIIGTTYIYEPLKIEDSYLSPPDAVCEGHEISASYLVDIKGGPYTIERTTGIFSWIGAGEDQRPLGGVYFDRPSSAATDGSEWVEDQDDQTIPTPIRRLAPTIDGKYYNNVQAVVKGKMFGVFPVSQEISYVSDTPITVLPEDDEQCQDERGSG